MLFILLIIVIFLFITQLYHISGHLKVCEHQNSYVKKKINCIYIHSNQIFIYFYMINCNIIVCVGKLLNKCSFTTFNSLSNIYFIEHNEISLLTSKRLLSIQFENNIFTPN